MVSIRWILIALLLAAPVYAAQPELPTLFYGQVYDVTSGPAERVEVSVTWTDSAGFEHTRKVLTLTEDEAKQLGSTALAGVYLFNEGHITAAHDSSIQIEVEDSVRQITARPGESPLPVAAITLGEDTLSGISDFVPETSGSGGGEPTGGESTGRGVGGEGRDTDEDLPSAPTSVVGQVTDEAGNPIGGEIVEAEWTDENGVEHTAEAQTLTKEEAEALGDLALEGFYSFNDGEIVTRDPITITTKTDNQKTQVTPSPGNIVQAEPRILYGFSGNRRTPTSEERFFRGKGALTGVVSLFALVWKGIVTFFAFSWKILSIVLFLGALFILGFQRTKFLRTMRHVKAGMQLRSLNRNMKKLSDLHVHEFMTKKIITIGPRETLQNAVNLMVTERKGGLVVVHDNHPVGVLTEKDILRKVGTNVKHLDLKVQDAMSSRVLSVPSHTTLSVALNVILENNVRRLLIVRKGRLEGIVSDSDLADAILKFYRLNNFLPRNAPVIRSAVSRSVCLLHPETKVAHVVCKLARNCDVVLATRGGELAGIVTPHDVINIFYKNPDMLRKLELQQIMSKHVSTTTPGTDIFKVNNIMKEKRCRRMPVLVNKKIVGVIDQVHCLEHITAFLDELSETQLEDLITPT